MAKIKHNLIRTDISGGSVALAGSWPKKPWFNQVQEVVGPDLNRNSQFNDLANGQRMQFGEWWYSLEKVV